MEISEITIRNFKGIKEVTLGPIKSINVLIGRNNSGKSSVLTCLQLLNKYFMAVGSAKVDQPNITLSVPNECFKREEVENTGFEVSVKVEQTREEREAQFKGLVELNPGQMDADRIKIQLDGGLFSSLIFDFKGARGNNKNPFGLIEIKTVEGGKIEKIATVPQNNTGVPLRGLSLMHLFVRRGSLNKVSDLAKVNHLNENILINLKTGKLIGITHPIGPDRDDIRSLLNPPFEHIKKIFQTSFLVSPYRHGNPIAAAQRYKEINESGANLVNYLHDLHLNNYEAFQKVAGFVKGIAPEVGRLHPRFVKEEGSELELAYEWPDGRVVNLANMGGGVEQLLILGCILLQQKTSCVLWEEPESHLHPAAQEILLNKLEEYVHDSKIFITTHSPVFIRSSDMVAVNIITNKDGKSGTGRTLSATELQEAATVIGSRPGHLAQADIVVYVEGKRGAEAFEEWLKKWPARDKVLGHLLLSIWFLSPDDIGARDFDLAPSRKVTQNMIMFVDKDNDEGSSEPKPSRKELQEKCKALGIPCIITDKRQIEDCFPEQLINDVLHDKSPDLHGEWSKTKKITKGMKRYNRFIAAAMKWEDVEKNKDIMKVFEEIEKYAKNLKPETNVG